MDAHVIQGQRVALPVEVRDAVMAAAVFAVPAGTAQAVIAYSGLEVAEIGLGRAVCALAFVRYDDGDLGRHHEFAVTFLVRPPGTGHVGAFVHWLPVDRPFTLEAGRTIWGFPKEMAALPQDHISPTRRCAVRLDGEVVLSMAVRPGLPAPTRDREMTAYTHLDGVTRRVPWTVTPSRVRTRPGGALVRLGDHPLAEELRTLGIGRVPALASMTARLSMSVGGAESAT